MCEAIAPATRLLESIGSAENPNKDYPIYWLYPIVFRDALTVCHQVISYAKQIEELRSEIQKSPCGKWGHLMIHTHRSLGEFSGMDTGVIVCDLCAREEK